MTAAITAARLGHEVTLYERQARAGRKLMATGNGRCNLTNTGAAPSNYHGEAPAFVRPALEGFGPAEALDFFRGLGLLVREEHGGRVYPLSNSANSVVDVLRQGLEATGVRLAAGDRVRELRRAGAGFAILTESGEKQNFDAVVVACGGLAGEKLGGGRDGYELLKSLGHTRTALRPALVQITTEPAYPRSLKGIKADCALRLVCGGAKLGRSEGELLFTETGVSGPAAFDLSRAVSAAGGGGAGAGGGLPAGLRLGRGAGASAPPRRGRPGPAGLGAFHGQRPQPSGADAGEIRGPGRGQGALGADGARAARGGLGLQALQPARTRHGGFRLRPGDGRRRAHLGVLP